MASNRFLNLRIVDNRCIFFSGEQVKGYCDVQLRPNSNCGRSIPKNVEISVHLFGFGRVHWAETKTRPVVPSRAAINSSTEITHHQESSSQQEAAMETYQVNYEQNRTYLDLEQTLFLSPRNGSENNVISLPFSFHLPNEVVPSFEHSNANVRYWIEATIEKLQVKEIANIDVVQHFDYNNPLYCVPIVESKLEKIGCICCSSGPFLVQASLDRSGFYWGEPITLSARFENHDFRREALLHVKLKQHITLRAEGQTKPVSNSWDLIRPTSSSSRNSSCILSPSQVASWTRETFLLPRLNMPSIVDAVIFEVNYSLEIGVSVNWSGDLSVSLPITIGSPVNSASGVTITQQILPFQQNASSQNNPRPLEPPPSYDSIYGREEEQRGIVRNRNNTSIQQEQQQAPPSSGSPKTGRQETRRSGGGWRSWFRSWFGKNSNH